MTTSLQERLNTLATESGRDRLDIQKKFLLLAGVMAECLMDYDNPFEELRLLKDALIEAVNASVNEKAPQPFLSAVDLDKHTETGRSLARLYMDDEENMARTLRDSVLNIAHHDLKYGPFSDQERRAQAEFLYYAIHYSLAFEVIAHLFCDRVIDLKIAQDKWSVGDSLMAMSGLAGRYYAFAALEDEDHYTYANVSSHSDGGDHKPCRPEQMLQMISAEAMRMGVLEGGDLLRGIAANDADYRACPHLVYSLEPSFAVLADRYEIEGYALKSIAVAKATGRMIAVACTGQDAEMEQNVVRPLTVASFIGSLSHFSPA